MSNKIYKSYKIYPIIFFLVITNFINLNTSITSHQLSLSKDIFNNSDKPFISHQGTDKLSTYLTMDVNYSPIESLYHQLEKYLAKKLITRGEAHITVITPIEYYDVLKTKNISIEDINNIALSHGIQSSKFNIVCLGAGEKLIDSELESTYYIVISSEDLLNIRRAIQNLFIKNGGAMSEFSPEHYYPHITIGFTKRDLHESDDVIKNTSSCIKQIDML